jgi:hypothetical protein
VPSSASRSCSPPLLTLLTMHAARPFKFLMVRHSSHVDNYVPSFSPHTKRRRGVVVVYVHRYVQFCCKHVLETCRPEMEFFVEKVDKEAINRLETVANTPFVRLTYTDACTLLIEHSKEKKVKFNETVKVWHSPPTTVPDFILTASTHFFGI